METSMSKVNLINSGSSAAAFYLANKYVDEIGATANMKKALLQLLLEIFDGQIDEMVFQKVLPASVSTLDSNILVPMEVGIMYGGTTEWLIKIDERSFFKKTLISAASSWLGHMIGGAISKSM